MLKASSWTLTAMTVSGRGVGDDMTARWICCRAALRACGMISTNPDWTTRGWEVSPRASRA